MAMLLMTLPPWAAAVGPAPPAAAASDPELAVFMAPTATVIWKPLRQGWSPGGGSQWRSAAKGPSGSHRREETGRGRVRATSEMACRVSTTPDLVPSSTR